MKRLVRFFVMNPLFGDLLTVAVSLMGLLALFNIKRDVFPNVNFDVVSIMSIYPGASAEEVEKYVTNPIEQDLTEVDGVDKLFSASVEGRSEIFIQLDPDQTTSKKAKDDVQDVIDRIQDLPAVIEDPIVTELQSKDQPIIEVVLAGDMDKLALRDLARDVEKRLERIDGVARVVHRGLQDKEIRVEVSLAKLGQYRLALEDVIQALRSQNLSIPGGATEPLPGSNEKERLVRTIGDFRTLDDVKETVIRANDVGQTVKVKDVANVFFDLEKASVINRVNGKPSQALTVLKKEASDAIQLVDQVRDEVAVLGQELKGRASFSFINDFSEYIRRRLSILTGNLLIGLVLVLALLPLMIPFRFALIVAMGEPFAFLGAILVLHLCGFSINLISMIGLIIVSGILVDDSIVVTENAVRLIEDEGMDPHEAAIEGTMQIMGPVTASVAATALAFLPMAFMSGIFGKFVREIPIAVITCLLVSLFETYFILPSHIAHWIKKKDVSKMVAARKNSRWVRFLESTRLAWERYAEPAYLRFLDFGLRRRYVVLMGFFALLIGTGVLVATRMKVVLFPPEGVEIFFVRAEAPHGTALEATSELVKGIEAAIQALPDEELNDFTTSIGLVQNDPNDPNTKRGGEYAQMAVYLSPENERERSALEIIEDLRKKIAVPAGLVKVSFERVNPGPPQGKPVSLGLRGDDYAVILPAAATLEEFLKKIKGVSDVANTYAPGKEELRVRINPADTAAAGLSVATVGNSVRAAYAGTVATSVKELDEEVDVRVSLPRSERALGETLNRILVPNPQGNLVPISLISRIEPGQGVASYEHEANRRQVKVQAEVDVDVISAIEANNQVRKFLPEMRKLHPQVEVEFGGEDKDTQESLKSLVTAFGAAMIGIFLILVLTFKGLLQPLAILITVPLGFVAVMWAFFVHGSPITFLGSLGIVALSGIIVNNAIVFIDFANQARLQGMEKMESIREAARVRLRPIFLTTVTTTIGVLPTAYGIGGMDKFVVPIALALGWGLLFGAVLTAAIFPSVLAILDDVTEFGERRLPSIANFYKSNRH